MEPSFFDRFHLAEWPQFWRIWDMDDGPVWLATVSIMSLMGYASLATFLTWHALRRFEAVAGRAAGGAIRSPVARRSAPARPAGQRPAVMSGRPAPIRPVSLNSSTRAGR